MTARPTAAELLNTPGALLTRSDMRALGHSRRSVDAILRELPVVVLPGYARPLVRAEDYIELLAASTFDGNRVRPTR